MAVEHRFRLLTHDGQALRDLDRITRVEWLRVLNDKGWFSMVLPGDYPTEFLDVDRLIEIWRQPDGGEPGLEMVGFLRKWEWFEGDDGTELLRLSGPDQIDLLDRRAIRNVVGSPGFVEKSDPTDDVIKAIVREGVGALSGLDPEGRSRQYLPADHFSVAADLGDGPTLTRSFRWRDMLPVLQELAEASLNQGSPLFFDCVPDGPAQFEFRTYIPVRGIDHTLTAGIAPIVFSKEAGNLANPALIEDYTEEWNYVWGGGQGEGDLRLIDTENDLLRINRSLWNRREVFQDAREEDTALGVASKAYERMESSRPRLIFTGDLLDSPRARYGVEWGFGDKVTAQYKGLQFDGFVRLVQFTIGNDGTEALRARLEVVRATG